MPFEELDEGQQTERPTDAVAIAQPLVSLCCVSEPFAGGGEIAGEEGDPGAVLFDVCQAALVAEGRVQAVGFTEEPLGIDQRATEHLDEPAHAQRVRELSGFVGVAEQVDRLTELAAGVVDAAGDLAERTTQPERLGLQPHVGEGLGQHLQRVDVVAGGGEVALVDVRAGAHRVQVGELGVVGAGADRQLECSRRMAHGHAQAAGVERAIGGGGEQDDCLLDHVGGHTLDGAQLLHQLCCRCRVVCPIVELADRAHRLGHAGVALRAGGLGEGLVRGIANRLAAELPPATVHFDETELVELVHQS